MNHHPPDSHEPDPDDRSPFARAFDKASQIFAACLIMVVPCIGGYFLDQYLGIRLVFTLLGLLFGFIAGLSQMIKIVNSDRLEN